MIPFPFYFLRHRKLYDVNWFTSRIQTVKIVLHLEFNDLMQIFTKNQQYADSGENGMVKIQIELQGVINILEENWKTSLANRL